jgi:hypothetical protein
VFQVRDKPLCQQGIESGPGVGVTEVGAAPAVLQTIHLHEEFDIDEIRLEIKVHEFTRATQNHNLNGMERAITSEMQNPHHNSKVSLQTGMHVTNGFREEYPFSVNLPAGLPPTYRGINATNAWFIKSVAAVRGRPDIVGHDNEIQVTG